MSKSFMVVGMHRSATSLIAKALHDQGVDMGGPLLGANDSNPLGHYEDLRVIEANDSLLARDNGSWDNPPKKLHTLDENTARQIVLNRADLWGMKDPRLSLTLDLWLPYMGDDPHVVACFRKPEKVADSLLRRDNIDWETNYKLAKIYNRRLIRSIRKFVGD